MSANVPTLEGTAWVAHSNGSVPDGGLVGGADAGNEMYVVRSEHNGAVIPGKLIPSHSMAYIPWGGEEHSKTEYEVLVTPMESVTWMPNTGGNIPEKAIPGGISLEDEVLYIGRAVHEGALTVGKVHPSHGCLYISYGGAEISYPEYEILVLN